MSDRMMTGQAYRRGMVLGLSLAELFIILLFLILLASIGFNAALEDVKNQKNAQIEDLKTQLAETQLVLDTLTAKFKGAPDDFQKLIARAEEANRLEETLSVVQPLLDILNSDPSLRQNRTQVVTALVEALDGKNFDQISHTFDLIAQIPLDQNQSVRDLTTLYQENTDLKKQNETLARLVELYGTERGDNPPCLYKDRPTDDPLFDTKPYKEIYIFDVYLAAQSITVVSLPLESGDWGAFPDKKPDHSSRDILGRALSFSEFKAAFSRYRDLGQNKEIRPYPCAFFVRVWWDKSMSSVQYQTALSHLESIFFKSVMRNVQWPHSRTW